MNKEVSSSFEVNSVDNYKRIIFPGTYIQGKNIIANLTEILNLKDKNILIIATKFAFKRIIPSSIINWNKHANIIVEKFSGESDLKEINRLVNVVESQDNKIDIIIGLGGGKVLDTAKSVAYRTNTKCGVIPTIAASDAPCIGVSVIYDDKQCFQELEFLPNPDFVFVDSQIIIEAPVRYLAAGIGDTLSTWFEAQSCEKSSSPNYTNSFRTDTGYFIAKLSYENLFKYGKKAIEDCKNNDLTEAVEHIIEANILLSGVGVENTGLASPHFIQFGLSQLSRTHGYLHGEEVAIGVLASLFLSNKTSSEIDKIFSFCESVGLPVTLDDIGLSNPSEEELLTVAETACNAGVPNCHEPFEVCPKDIVEALKKVDSYGKSIKNKIV
ncbi:MAG: glycerol dehydrogenase [bacterium]|nr:glycerol dehydrogenase [bacterium]